MKRLLIWAGPVISSKSTRALGYAKRLRIAGNRVVLVRPAVSIRQHESPGNLVTRGGDAWPSVDLQRARDIVGHPKVEAANVLWVDEPNLWDDEADLFEILQRVRKTHMIMVSGCPATSELEPFGTSFPKLMAVADDIHWCKADCHYTNTMESASRSVCLVKKVGQRLVGGAESYSPASPEAWTRLQQERLGLSLKAEELAQHDRG